MAIDEEETEGATLLGRTALCARADNDAVSDDGVWQRISRVLSCRRMLQPTEIAGSLGDLGTFLPDMVSLANNPHGAYPYPQAFTFFNGLWSVYAGVAYDIPMPIQPMHAVTAIALTEGLPYPHIVTAGVWLGLFFFIIGATGVVGVLRRAIPLPVVRGLQLGLGLKIMGTGIGLARRGCTHWVNVHTNLDGYVLCALAVLIALVCYGHPRRHASLVLFALGCVGILYSRPRLVLGAALPVAPPPPLTAEDWWGGLVNAALPQAPVTLLNAVVSTAKLAVTHLEAEIVRTDAPRCKFRVAVKK